MTVSTDRDLSRRSFLKGAGMVGAGLAASGGIAGSALAEEAAPEGAAGGEPAWMTPVPEGER